MQLTVKTLKGGKFTIEVDPSNTVAQAKAVIVSHIMIIIIQYRSLESVYTIIYIYSCRFFYRIQTT